MRHTSTPIRALLAVVSATLVCLFALAACTSSSKSAQSPPASDAPAKTPGSSARPNIVFVLTDDLSSDLVRYMPHVQGLQRVGTTFTNHYVVDSLCCPSRTAIFTGQYAHNNGVFTNQGDDGGYGAFNHFDNPKKSFAVSLHNAGYRTGFMGKYLNGYSPSDDPAPGWDEWDVAGDGYRGFNYHLNENGTQHVYRHRPQDYLTDVLSRKAVDFIKTSKQQNTPFALEVATFAPHHPWVPAPRDINTFPTLKAPQGPAFDRTPTNAPKWLAAYPKLSAKDLSQTDHAYQRRVESVQAVDRMVGRLEQVLRTQGQLQNTYFVFSSDNGFHMGEYRLLPGKQTAFDTDIRVPLVVSGPGVPAGGKVDAITSSIDLAPTFNQIGGAHPSDTPDGVSLLSLWHGRVPPAWQQAVLVEHHGPDTVAGDPDKQPIRSGDPPSYQAIRTANALYVEYDTGEREYYDTVADPYELHNIASTVPASTLAPIQRALHTLSTCKGAQTCQAAARLG